MINYIFLKNLSKNFFSTAKLVKNTKTVNKHFYPIKNTKKHKYDIENESWTEPKQKTQLNYSYITYHLIKKNNTKK